MKKNARKTLRKPTRAKQKRTNRSDAKVVRVALRAKREQGATSGLAKAAQQLRHVFNGEPRDVAAAIKMDHDSLRHYIKILKDTDQPMSERRGAYKAFASLLKSHSVAEEEIVYRAGNQLTGRELHLKIAEGYVEHQMCDDLMRRIERARNPLSWGAHANVLAEILEHHLAEEERDLMPEIRKKLSASTDDELLQIYARKRAQTQKTKSSKNKGVLANYKS